LDMFWNLMQDECGVAGDTSKGAAARLAGIIEKSMCTPYRASFVKNCVKNLEKGTSVTQSLKLLLKIFDQELGRDESIDALAAQYDLLKLFFKDLVHYKEQVYKIVCEVRTVVNNNHTNNNNNDENNNNNNNNNIDNNLLDFDNRVFVGIHPHLKQIRVRLQFLNFLLLNSPSVFLSLDFFDILWEWLVEKGVTRGEKDLAFDWIADVCCVKYAWGHVDQLAKAQNHIFFMKLCKRFGIEKKKR